MLLSICIIIRRMSIPIMLIIIIIRLIIPLFIHSLILSSLTPARDLKGWKDLFCALGVRYLSISIEKMLPDGSICESSVCTYYVDYIL